MTSLFERVIRRSEMWLDLIDRERDRCLRAKPECSSEFWQKWIDRLEAERRDVALLIQELKILRHRRSLLFEERPTNMAKATDSPAPAARRKSRRKEA